MHTRASSRPTRLVDRHHIQADGDLLELVAGPRAAQVASAADGDEGLAGEAAAGALVLDGGPVDGVLQCAWVIRGVRMCTCVHMHVCMYECVHVCEKREGEQVDTERDMQINSIHTRAHIHKIHHILLTP